VLPAIARVLSSDPSSYRYLAESAASWLTQPQLAAALRAAGWQAVSWQDLLFGAVALHCAQAPA
jgi:demethylmenaquinone methyltransferase/2-methoxy-6-polyprenyl-1,4-benzoquinol methylase